MATAVLTNTPTTIDLAEATTNWGGDTFLLDADIKVQGDNSVYCTFTPNAGNNQEIYVTGTWDFTGTGVGDQHLRLWMNNVITAYLETEALDGIQIFLYDGSNANYWTVGGSDTYGGGWYQFMLYTGDTPTEDNGANHATITRIGIRMAVHTRPRNAINLWLDAWRYGDGYTVTGGTNGDEIDWSHISALDVTEAYGIVTRLDDIYFLGGAVEIGFGATTTYFKSGQKVQFKDLPVLSTLYDVTFGGTACNVDIAGGSYGAAGIQDYLFDVSDATINSFALTGVQFAKSNSLLFSAGQSITNTVFDECLQTEPSTSTFEGNTFSNSISTSGAMLFPSDDTNVNGITFINCDNGVEYAISSDSTTPSFRTFTFDDVGGKYDVNNTSGAEVAIDIVGGGNANSYNPGGSVVTFNNFIYHNLTNLVDGSEVTYMKFGAAEDTGTTGETTAGSRNFDDLGKSWSPDQYRGRVLIIEEGADIGRYYVYSNSATQLKLDTALTATAATLDYSIQDENDMTEEFHEESVTGNQTQYGYNYTSDFSVDIMIQNVDYEEIVLLDILLSDSDQTIPINQKLDVNYFNPT